MGDVVNLQGAGGVKWMENHEFIVDMARFAEALTDEVAIRKKYRLADAAWEALGADDELVRAITDEKTRRIRTGASKREKAQGLIVRAPDVLAGIMDDASASPRHRVDAIKVLDGFTGNPQEGAPLADRFVITINLSGDGGSEDVLHFNKSIAINANDGETNDTNGIDSGPVRSVHQIAHEPKTHEPGTHETVRSVEGLSAAQQAALESLMQKG